MKAVALLLILSILLFSSTGQHNQEELLQDGPSENNQTQGEKNNTLNNHGNGGGPFFVLQCSSAKGGTLWMFPSSTEQQNIDNIVANFEHNSPVPLPDNPIPASEAPPPLTNIVSLRERDARRIVNYYEMSDFPNDCFDPVYGAFTAKTSGCYHVSAEVQLFSPYNVGLISIIPTLHLIKKSPNNTFTYIRSSLIQAWIGQNATLPPDGFARPLFRILSPAALSININVDMEKDEELSLYILDAPGFPAFAINNTNTDYPFGGYSITQQLTSFSIHQINKR